MTVSNHWLILGGARSGKSSYAESLAPETGERIYIATAEAHDDEMHERIAAHRRARGDGWTTIDAPYDLSSAISAHATAGKFVLVDCMTLWLSNIMMSDQDCDTAVRYLIQTIGAAQGTLVIVSNEVGLSIVPDNALARRFRDLAGRTNQQLAAACGNVVMVTAGLPMMLKSAG